MDVHIFGWLGLAALIVGLLVVDFVGHARRPHPPTIKESAYWSLGYVVLAVALGFVIWPIYGLQFAGEYWAGWLTEKSLSLDNLFVFVIIMAAFQVPRADQQKVLLLGIVIAIVFRAVFILAGAALIQRFSWIFYIFGIFLLWTAWTQIKEGFKKKSEDEGYKENAVTRAVRKIFPVTEGFVSDKMLHRHAGRTYITPMLIVTVAIGSADLMFAVDSIPAIFGLTKEPFIVCAANAMSLLGLLQLYFLIDGLLERLVFLSFGLAAILGFIGFKLIVHALHSNTIPFINGGNPVLFLPEPGITSSMLYILVVLVITLVASMLYSRRKGKQRG